MKALYILLFLLVGLKPAISDSTLTFKVFSAETSRSNSYYLKDHQLRLLEENSDLFNVYNSNTKTFSSRDNKTGKTSHLNTQILNQQIKALKQQRLKKLTELETQIRVKLKDKNETEKKVGESLINQLKYPEFYGAHTTLKIHKTKQSKTINRINCDVYIITRKNSEIKQVCIADNKSLKLDLRDYNNLLDFQHFNYTSKTGVLLAMGQSDFDHIDYQQENINGIPIEIINIAKKTNKLEMMLLNVSRKKLDKSLFTPTKL